jgi:hypothetical protein
MDGHVKNIVLTALYLESGRPNYDNLSTDVIVQFDDDVKYIATFISSESLAEVINELKEATADARTYKVLNAVLVKDFNHGDLMPVIDAMLTEGDFQLVFRKV